MFFMVMMTTTLLFLSANHPLSMGMALLIQSITISIISGNLALSFWFSYILFMVMVGGMLVLFIYMTSIASNEKFKLSLKIVFISMLNSIMLIMMMKKSIMFYSNNNTANKWEEKLNFLNLLNKYLNFPASTMYLMMIIYLLITLIAVIKITKINMGPLRKIS